MTRARQATRLAGALSGALLLALGVSGLAAGQGGPLLEAKSPTGASPGPSRAVYPPQRVPLRFDHALHLGPVGLTCVACHAEARTSDASRDRLLPAGTACDACHGTDHSDLLRVTAPDTPVPYSPPLEEFFLPNKEKILKAARHLAAY